MFNNIPPAILKRMRLLEELDARDRADGTPFERRLRQIPPDTGRFLALLAASAPPGEYLEIGTSAAYSTMWLALACREAGRRLVTFEIFPERARWAEETIREAGIGDVVELVPADARQKIGQHRDISFCFLDAEKSDYLKYYELVVPNMVPGGILAADNALSHEAVLRPMVERVFSDPRVDAVVASIDRGLLICRRHGV
jgi:predicted O-methyltransferase YrrM